ncbi:class I SAM-dependent methyltransferase [Flammeovirga sp. SubArs3]|uniref:class I SAM-dependent methyltransferase n=1 Tax=Flammeovirga sp. SubArs3 TaxID=2995316 RepID=UPI00248AA1D0|nr:class I SAM-dependent methyltransferase [Flammeovirga sp. SubArs3]
MNFQEEFEANRLQWNARVESHVASKMYDVPGFISGDTSLKKVELTELKNLEGKKVLHLQCHFGLDSLSMARVGADVTALDISDTAIEKAEELNQQLGLNTKFITANLYDIKKHLPAEEQFDLVFVSYGAICWLPDLTAWADIIASYLKKGGEFYMVEMHPYIYTLDWDRFTPEYHYYNKGVYKETVTSSYADDTPMELTEYFWVHSVDEIINSLMKKGLSMTKFREHDYQTYNCFDNMIERAKDEFVFKDVKVNIPYLLEVKFQK